MGGGLWTSSVVEDEALLGEGCRLYLRTMIVSHLRNWKRAVRRTCTGRLHAAAALSEVDLRQGTPHENSPSSSVHRRECEGGIVVSVRPTSLHSCRAEFESAQGISMTACYGSGLSTHKMREGNNEHVRAMLKRLSGQWVGLSTLDRHMRACLGCLELKTRNERGELVRTILRMSVGICSRRT